MHWRRKWQPTSVLAWRIPGAGEPGGLLSMGSHRVGHDWSDAAAAQQVPHSLDLTSFLCLTSSFSPQITFCASYAKFFTFLQFTILFLKSPPLHILFPLPPTSDNFPFNFQEPAKIASLLWSPCMRACLVASVVSDSMTLWTSLPGSSTHGILQARILEWVAMPSSKGSSWPRNQTWVSCGSCIAGRFFTAELPGKPCIPRTWSWYLPDPPTKRSFSLLLLLH